MATAKILCIGPAQAGKTRLCNYIADFDSDPDLSSYEPTAAVRVLEFDREVPTATKRGPHMAGVEVALWDCSGDEKYSACWPAILANVTGVLLVFNPETPSHEREAARWYGAFVKKLGLGEGQVLLVAHHKEARASDTPTAAPPALAQFPVVDSSFEDPRAMADLRTRVDAFLGAVGAAAAEKRSAEMDDAF